MDTEGHRFKIHKTADHAEYAELERRENLCQFFFGVFCGSHPSGFQSCEGPNPRKDGEMAREPLNAKCIVRSA